MWPASAGSSGISPRLMIRMGVGSSDRFQTDPFSNPTRAPPANRDRTLPPWW